jgi:hypothetical protein
MTWQPIETAPRDGTEFLVPPMPGFVSCFWQDGFYWYVGEQGDYAVGPDPEGWMPLPPPPAMAPTGEKP